MSTAKKIDLSLWGRLSLLVAAGSLVPGTMACLDHPLKRVKVETQQEKGDNIALAINRDVDILFVIDNSGSMSEEQANLARNFGTFIDTLDEAGANYRIAVTTTDMGQVNDLSGYGCGEPERGSFQIKSCRDRMGEFIVAGAEPDEFFGPACTNVCSNKVTNLTTEPSTTELDAEPNPRPWIENFFGQTNQPPDISPTEAFQCVGPQGLRGCGYEAPLEAARLAMLKAEDPVSPEYGFRREGAILAVIIVTDEADCSARFNAFPEPWIPRGVGGSNEYPALWGPKSRDEGVPYSEVCWAAGVQCNEQGDGTKQCSAADIALSGEPTNSADDAVLYPLARYIDFFSDIEAEQQFIDPNQQVLVAVISGVPEDYSGGELVYRDAEDMDFQLNFGIGPGCKSSEGEAVPPVRLREFAEAFAVDDRPNLFSVCDEDYSPALRAIADAIADQVKPACVGTCVADANVDQPGVQQDCVLTETYEDADGRPQADPLQPCEEHNGKLVPKEGQDVCYQALDDATGSTQSTLDDMSEACIEQGWNLEFSLVRREGSLPPSKSAVSATCVVSTLSAQDCPNLR